MAGPIRLKIGLIHCVTHFKITNLFDDAKDMNQKSDIFLNIQQLGKKIHETIEISCCSIVTT